MQIMVITKRVQYSKSLKTTDETPMILDESHFYFNLQFEGSGREEKRLDHGKGIGEGWFE